MKLALRRRTLNSTFRAHYDDLLNAISTDNYESLEQLCEETFLNELAAKIYEFEKFKNIQFRICDSPSPHFSFQVLNHFYVNNVSI
jgi:hypothetical protein